MVTSDVRNSGDESGVDSRTLLFVCVANVCRSPALAFRTRRGLLGVGLATDWSFVSAGSRALRGERMCPSSATALSGVTGGADFAEAHRSRPLDAALVKQAALILVTSRAEQAVVARLAPTARSRTFTMIEAAALAEHAASASATRLTAEGPAGGVRSLVAVLHRGRGLVDLGKPAPRSKVWSPGRRRSTSVDIADAHTSDSHGHRAVLADVSWASERFSRSVGLLMGATE